MRKEASKFARARAHLQKLMKTERDSEQLRRLYIMDRIFDEKMTCSVCYGTAGSLSDNMDLIEYGYHCTNGHIMCFKCWFSYTRDFPIGTPWACKICDEKVPYMTQWPSGIQQGGGLHFGDGGSVYFLQDGKKVMLG